MKLLRNKSASFFLTRHANEADFLCFFSLFKHKILVPPKMFKQIHVNLFGITK